MFCEKLSAFYYHGLSTEGATLAPKVQDKTTINHDIWNPKCVAIPSLFFLHVVGEYYFLFCY
jgi:hypothetical protein